MRMKKFSLLFLLVSILFCCTQFSCHSPTAPDNNKLSLTVEDVSCTEAWLNLNTNDIPLPANIVITKNGKSYLSLKLTESDTVLYDSTLSPNQTYTYRAEYGGGLTKEESEPAAAKTLDTTSSNFTWQTFTFGVGGDNGLKDVAIINDTSIWAVGKFAIQDSGWYNAAHWNGGKWSYKKIEFYTICGQEPKSIYGTSSVYAFNDTTVWIAMEGDQIAVLDGVKQKSIICLPFSFGINKIWGENDKSVYVVGDGGNIIFYNGQSWERIESGTTLDIQDIWGVKDPKTGKENILCVASNVLLSNQIQLLQIKNNKAQVVSNKGLPPYYFSSIWFKNPHLAYLTGNNTYKSYNFFNNTGWTMVRPRITTYYSYSIRGNDLNDIFFCGSFGDLAHFNGVRWIDYLGNDLQMINGNLYSIAVKGNTVCAVGWSGSGTSGKAVITLGIRK
jgi:hypothetical protein